MKGTVEGPDAILAASHQVELFDDELAAETYKRGILTLEPLRFSDRNPESAVRSVEKAVRSLSETGKKIILLGGEHSVTVGAVRAWSRNASTLSVLHLDAHADLRPSYENSEYNHACVMARILETCPAVSVGIRSLSLEAYQRIRVEKLHVYTMHRIRNEDWWMEAALSHLRDPVYITVDLDVLDPSVLPGVGTPEPGGLGWEEILRFLQLVFSKRKVVAFDVVELCPKSNSDISPFIAAKLIYRMMGYWTKQH
jgi:agmatinase